MSVATVFLVVLVVSLIIGNVLLFFFPVGSKRVVSRGRDIHSIARQIAESRNAGEMEEPSAAAVSPAEKKIELAHARIQELESKLASLSGPGAYDESLKRRIEKLDNFRSTAESELIAMKEILAELQNRHITVKARTYARKEKDVSTEDMHRMIYRSSN